MAQSTKFDGANLLLKGPPNSDVTDLHVFGNGQCVVSCWQPTPEELEEINRTGKIFLSVFSGTTSYPVCVGSETAIEGLVHQHGGSWKRPLRNPEDPFDGLKRRINGLYQLWKEDNDRFAKDFDYITLSTESGKLNVGVYTSIAKHFLSPKGVEFQVVDTVVGDPMLIIKGER